MLAIIFGAIVAAPLPSGLAFSRPHGPADAGEEKVISRQRKNAQHGHAPGKVHIADATLDTAPTRGGDKTSDLRLDWQALVHRLCQLAGRHVPSALLPTTSGRRQLSPLWCKLETGLAKADKVPYCGSEVFLRPIVSNGFWSLPQGANAPTPAYRTA